MDKRQFVFGPCAEHYEEVSTVTEKRTDEETIARGIEQARRKRSAETWQHVRNFIGVVFLVLAVLIVLGMIVQAFGG